MADQDYEKESKDAGPVASENVETKRERGNKVLPLGQDERMEGRPHIEREDHVLRDPVNWNGQVASLVKEISRGEEGYDPQRQMMLLQTEDGATHVVPFSEISKTVVPTVAEQQVADRVPEESKRPIPTK